MNNIEYGKIEAQIKWTRDEMKRHYKGGVIQYSLISDLFKWLDNNGGCVFLSDKKIQQKTQDKHIETYIAKYGIKFQIISKYEKDSLKCIDRIIKIRR